MPDTQNRTPGANAHRFAPAAPDEDYVYGACSPGWHTAASREDALADWIGFMRARDVERVCCLLSGSQLDGPGGPLEVYRDVFGSESVRHAPIPDARLADPLLLEQDVLPFLDDAVEAEERVVVHCLAGLGRTGQILAAWLAHDRGYDPDEAIETVEEMGRRPDEPVRVDNATEQELRDLLALFA